MQKNNEQCLNIKRLYQTKFYQPKQQVNIIQKVLNFQKKLQKSNTKNIKSQRQHIGSVHTSTLLNQNQHNRPHTHNTTYRPKVNKYSLENKLIDNPVQQQLRFFISSSNKNQFSFLAENIRIRTNNAIKQNNKKQNKQLFQRQFTRSQNRNKHRSEIHISKDQLRDFFRSFNNSRKQVQRNLQSKTAQTSKRDRQYILLQNKKLIKQQLNILALKNQQKINKKSIDSKNLKQMLEIRRSKRINYKSSYIKDHKDYNSFKVDIKNETKKQINQDKILNIELKPWNTLQIQYL